MENFQKKIYKKYSIKLSVITKILTAQLILMDLFMWRINVLQKNSIELLKKKNPQPLKEAS